jgi:hypothetical protein
METIASKDPRAHTANVRKEFRELIDHLRDDIDRMDDPKDTRSLKPRRK